MISVHKVPEIVPDYWPEEVREEYVDAPDWAQRIVERGESVMREDMWKNTAERYFRSGHGAPWEAKEHVTPRTVWRVCRDIWGEVPGPIRRDVVWTEDEWWDESAPRESRMLMLRLLKTLANMFEAAADGFIFHYESCLEDARQAGKLDVLINVTRDQITIKSVAPEGSFE